MTEFNSPYSLTGSSARLITGGRSGSSPPRGTNFKEHQTMKVSCAKTTRTTYGLGDGFEKELFGFIAIVILGIGLVAVITWLNA